MDGMNVYQVGGRVSGTMRLLRLLDTAYALPVPNSFDIKH